MDDLIPCLARELRAAVDAELATFGITAQQGALVVRLAAGEDSPGQLAGQLGTDTAGMTRLVDRLEDKQLVRRSRRPGDRRAVVIELTDAGQALSPQVAPVISRVTERLTAGFTPAEREAAAVLLRRMLDNLHRPDAP